MEEKTKLTRRERTIKLVQKYKSLSQSEIEALSQFVIVSIEGNRAYSSRNQQLIAMQLNNPTICGGFNQWRERGRKVRKGEHGALILFPVGVSKDDENGSDDEPTAFYSAIVFDISQTEEISTDGN